MRFSITTVSAAALPLLLALTTTAADPQQVVVEGTSSSIPPYDETSTVISTPLVLARQKVDLDNALSPPSSAASSPSTGLRGNPSKDATVAVEAMSATQDKWEKRDFWSVFYSNGDRNEIRDIGNNRMSITIAPWKEAVSAQSSTAYSGGRLEFKIKSASVMPGIITAVYFASGNGRTGDSSLGNQDGKEIQRTFEHIPSSVGALEAEEVGVEHLLRDINDPSVSTLANQVKHKLVALSGLRERLEEMQTYLQLVLAQKIPVNNQIIYNMQTIFNLLPNLNVGELVKGLMVKANDMHFIIYLSSLIRAIVALHGVVQNKIDFSEGEEGGKEGGKKKEKEGEKEGKEEEGKEKGKEGGKEGGKGAKQEAHGGKEKGKGKGGKQ
ncbi:hypothetical protein VYU27_008489 [Nannochloropsis oceanica]